MCSKHFLFCNHIWFYLYLALLYCSTFGLKNNIFKDIVPKHGTCRLITIIPTLIHTLSVCVCACVCACVPEPTNGTAHLVTDVAVGVLSHTAPAAILGVGAVAHPRATLDAPSTCGRTRCPWRPGTPTAIDCRVTATPSSEITSFPPLAMVY